MSAQQTHSRTAKPETEEHIQWSQLRLSAIIQTAFFFSVPPLRFGPLIFFFYSFAVFFFADLNKNIFFLQMDWILFNQKSIFRESSRVWTLLNCRWTAGLHSTRKTCDQRAEGCRILNHTGRMLFGFRFAANVEPSRVTWLCRCWKEDSLFPFP